MPVNHDRRRRERTGIFKKSGNLGATSLIGSVRLAKLRVKSVQEAW
jgi:hypothetical protein